jgi:hypothetical protein
MKFKAGVIWEDMHEAVSNSAFLADLDYIFKHFGVEEAVITSARDGVHQEDSFHYKGQAIDLRTHHVLDALTREIKRSLGVDYDVINEGDHIHVEYDPK